MTRFLTALIAWAVVFGTAAHAGLEDARPYIGFNLGADRGKMEPAHAAGVVEQQNWNNIGGTGPKTESKIRDAEGEPVEGVSITWKVHSTEYTQEYANRNENRNFALLKGFVRAYKGKGMKIEVAGLPEALVGSGYSVLVYADSKNDKKYNAEFPLKFIVGSDGTPQVIQADSFREEMFNPEDESMDYTDADGNPQFYHLFDVMPGTPGAASFVLTVPPSIESEDRRSINGLQIVTRMFSFTPTPEQSSWRTWTGQSGSKLEARMVSLAGDQVQLQDKRDRNLSIALGKLSEADRAYIRDLFLGKQAPKNDESPVPKDAPALVIKPTALVEDSGSYSPQSGANRLIAGTGLATDLKSGDAVPGTLPAHDRGYRNMWLSKGGEVEDQFIVFDLGQPFLLTDILVWPFAMSGREQVSVKTMNLYISAEGPSEGLEKNRSAWTRVNGDFSLDPKEPRRLALKVDQAARYVMLDILANHAAGDAFVGLSKIRFVGKKK